MSGDDFNWLPNKGSSITAETGPLADHHLPDQEGLFKIFNVKMASIPLVITFFLILI